MNVVSILLMLPSSPSFTMALMIVIVMIIFL